ncbi:MAG: hypothetical protein RJB39_708 [Candidatus Parcubacteria bacterium]|jgi:hypothetical protein
MSEITEEQFINAKTCGEELYKTFKGVYCPYFQEEVVFNAKGLEHLKFKQKNQARIVEDQYIRLKILKFAPEVLKQTRTIQGISEQKVFELQRSNHRNHHILVDAMYYEFVAIITQVRVRVIVKQIGTGPKYFWSIIPFWSTDRNLGERKLHYGSPEHD